MMSDEEENGEGFVRHPPSYRSEVLNNFIAKLDSRYDKTQQKTQPRKKRVLGSPVKKAVPHNAKNWLLKSEFQSTSAEEPAVTELSEH